MDEGLSFLQEKARELRRRILDMIFLAQSGHPGGSLSLADIVTALYFSELRIDPKNPEWKARDRVILSKGHACPVIYAVLAMKEYFPMEILDTLRQFGSILQGHPDMKRVPGVDMTSGSLGQGLSIGVGMAIGAKADGLPSRIFVLLGDGELDEGQVWEAAMCAAKYKLENLVAIIDNNGLQNDGFCRDIMPLDHIKDIWLAFGWEVITIDGHNMDAILNGFSLARQSVGKPACIIAKTVKGKGIAYMENVCSWHGCAPDKNQYEIACGEIEGGGNCEC